MVVVTALLIAVAAQAASESQGASSTAQQVDCERPVSGCHAVGSGEHGPTNAYAKARCWSSDGRWVAFEHTTIDPRLGRETRQIMLVDSVDRSGEIISRATSGELADTFAWHPSISADGNVIAYESSASNLPDVPTERRSRILIFDRATKATRGIAGADGDERRLVGGQEPSLTASGELVVFAGCCRSLEGALSREQIWTYDRSSKALTVVSVDENGELANRRCRFPVVSADGSTVVFGSDASNLDGKSNGDTFNVFARDLRSKRTRRLMGPVEAEWDERALPITVRSYCVSANGRYVAFNSFVRWDKRAHDGKSVASFLMDRDSGDVRRLDATLFERGDVLDIQPHWISSDGTRVGLWVSTYAGVGEDHAVEVATGKIMRASCCRVPRVE